MSTIDVRRADERFHTDIDWLDSWHSFSFSDHYDAKNTHFGLLRVLNDDVVNAGGGFGTHPHRDMEIVTWVLEGALEHRDSEGNVGIITPGMAQRMSAGTGVRHSEANASKTEAVHLLQMWVPPDAFGDPPGYEQRDVSDDIGTNALFPLASGAEHVRSAIHINQDDATLWVGRLTTGATVTMPDSPFVHVFVARGAATLEGAGDLATGDAVRLTEAGRLELTATADDTEVVVWDMQSELADRPRRVYLTSRDKRRSASTLPPVWHVGQYTTSCDSYETRLSSLPHSGHGSPFFPCTVKCSPSLLADSPPVRCRSRSRPSASTSCSAPSMRSRSSGFNDFNDT